VRQLRPECSACDQHRTDQIGTSSKKWCSLFSTGLFTALDAGVPLRDAQILARHADPRTTEHYDRARGNLDRHGVHFLTAYVAGV